MSIGIKSRTTRSSLLRTGGMLAAALIVLALWTTGAHAGARAPVKVLDFQTSADVAKAEEEGEVIYYGHDSESGISTLLNAFKKDFPKIKTGYVRLQTGALYAKLTSKRSQIGSSLTSSNSRKSRRPWTFRRRADTSYTSPPRRRLQTGVSEQSAGTSPGPAPRSPA